MANCKIKILIIDDSVDWLKIISLLLNCEEDMMVIGTVSNINDSLNLVKLLKPDVILLDLYFSDNKLEGLEFIEKIKLISNTKIIITTNSEELIHVEKALLSGAKDFVVKENFKKLPETIREVVTRWSTAEIMASMVENYEKLLIEKKKDDLLNEFNLTAREKEVFSYMEIDLNRAQMAHKMYTSESTIKNHTSSILKKLSVSNSKEALRI